MGLTGILNLAKSSLLTAQTSIQTTANNIANANTKGYSRQRVNLEAGAAISIGGNLLGTGVSVSGVDRVYDRFLGLQINDARETMGQYDSMSSSMSRLEGIFNDSQGLGLESVMNEFFNALQDVANDPGSNPARTVLLGKAGAMAARINGIDSRAKREVENIEQQIKGKVNEINSLSSRIAALNEKIQNVEIGDINANGLRDERDSLINDIAEMIDISVLEDSDGKVTILAAGGNAIVTANGSSSLTVSKNSDNNLYYDVMFGNRDITANVSSGNIRGLLDARDTNYQDTLNRLDVLSASLTKEFNVLHNAGFGLGGAADTGNDFFTALSPTITAKSSNTGGATASVSINTLSSLTLDEYEIRFTSTSVYNIVNATDGTVVSTGNSYASGANIDFAGIRAVVTTGSTGPQSGDVFKVSVTDGAANNFGVSLTNANSFAAATNSSNLPGDNTNALAMGNLEDTKVLSSSGATFNSYYSSLVADIGLATSEATITSDAQVMVIDELEAYRQSVSGVSMDEEAANLIRYQYAYEAAAKVMTVVDSMLDTLMNLR